MMDVAELRVALTVEDFEAAIGFYRDALGLPQLADWSSEEGRVVLLEAGRATLEILDEPQAGFVDQVEVGRRVAGKVRLALQVVDFDAMSKRLIDAGAEQMAPAVITPWGDHNARLQSPDGMQLTLFEPDH